MNTLYKDVYFELRRDTSPKKGFHDSRRVYYDFIAIIPKDKYTIEEDVLRECSITEDDPYYRDYDNLDSNYIINIPYSPKIYRPSCIGIAPNNLPVIASLVSSDVFDKFIYSFLENFVRSK